MGLIGSGRRTELFWVAALAALILSLPALVGFGEGEEETETVLCQDEPNLVEGELVCPEGQTYSGRVIGTLLPKAQATFKAFEEPEGVILCDFVDSLGVFEADGTSTPETGQLKMRFFSLEGCTVTIPGLESSEPLLSLDNGPYTASRFVYLGASPPQGEFTIEHEEGGHLRLRLEGAELKCFYTGPTALTGFVYNGSPTKVVLPGKWEPAAGSEACPAALNQSVALGLSREHGEELPIYIARE